MHSFDYFNGCQWKITRADQSVPAVALPLLLQVQPVMSVQNHYTVLWSHSSLSVFLKSCTCGVTPGGI